MEQPNTPGSTEGRGGFSPFMGLCAIVQWNQY